MGLGGSACEIKGGPGLPADSLGEVAAPSGDTSPPRLQSSTSNPSARDRIRFGPGPFTPNGQ